MTQDLHPLSIQSADFLCWLNPNTPAHLETMQSQGSASPRPFTYNSCDADGVTKFVEKHNDASSRRNIYFVPNAEFLHGKRIKANIEYARFLHVDLDFKDYPGDLSTQAERIVKLLFESEVRPTWIPHPTAVWKTGGGYQAVWRLTEPLDPTEAEALNIALLRDLEGGLGTHDVSRLLRLPGTVNWLNDKKRKDGRDPAQGCVVFPTAFNAAPVSYSAEQLAPPKRENTSSVSATVQSGLDTPIPIVGISLPENPECVLPNNPEWRSVIMNGTNPASKIYNSRSERMFAATIWMLATGLKPGMVLSVLLCPKFAIGEHIRDNHPDPSGAQRYAERQVRRAQMANEARKSTWPSITEKGQPTRDDPNNIRSALAKSGVVIRRNEFSQEDEFEGGHLEDRDFNDIADILCSAFQRKLEFSASSAAIKRELTSIAHENRYHPVLDYLNGLKWDGKSRIDTWLPDYCGAVDTELHREFSAKTLIGAVRRIRKPGSKFDTMLVLEGAQGVGKSRLLRMLSVQDEWFCESLNLRSDDRERAQVLGRAWIVECQELDGLNKMTGENLKKFLSESIDTYRKPYEKNARQYPRHCIIVGTTNESDYLRDLTGNRRFWPVRVGPIDLAGFQNSIDQLWAEAVAREAAGESVTLSSELWPSAAEAQADRVAEDPFADVISGALGDTAGKVSMDAVKMLLGIPTAKLTPYDSRRIQAAMVGQGWSYGTYRLWIDARQERRPVRGFQRTGSEVNCPEIGIRTRENGQIEVGEISKNGEFLVGSLTTKGEDDFPF